MSKVVTINNEVVIEPGTPRPDLIKMVEDVLEQTRSGRISGIAWAYLFSDDSSSHNAGGLITRGLIGAIEEMKIELIETYRKGV